MRRLACAVAMACLAAGAASAKPATITVGAPHPGALVYGPADMLCDLNKCRLFGLPAALHLPANAIVEFGVPQMEGQQRIELRRCFQLCRASVLGFASDATSPPGHGNPTVFITPIELRLE